jgi:hypothetical protein
MTTDFVVHGLLIDPVSLAAIDWMQPEPYQILCKDESEKKEYLQKIIDAGFVVAGEGKLMDDQDNRHDAQPGQSNHAEDYRPGDNSE